MDWPVATVILGTLATLAVVNRPEGTLAIFFECPAGKRGYWIGELRAFLATVRLRQ